MRAMHLPPQYRDAELQYKSGLPAIKLLKTALVLEFCSSIYNGIPESDVTLVLPMMRVENQFTVTSRSRVDFASMNGPNS